MPAPPPSLKSTRAPVVEAAQARLDALIRDVWPEAALLDVSFPDVAAPPADWLDPDHNPYHRFTITRVCAPSPSSLIVAPEQLHDLRLPMEECGDAEARRDWALHAAEADELVAVLIRLGLMFSPREYGPWDPGWPGEPERYLHLR